MAARTIAIVGGGPSGLAAAEVLSTAGHAVSVYDSMPTIGRKFLLAGKSGLNITHSEDFSRFRARFGSSNVRLRPALEAFTPTDVRAWAAGLGTATFVGSSGRVFPQAMKASPLLRAWRARLEARGVSILTRHRWIGFADGGLLLRTPEGEGTVRAEAVLLALGGASWPRLGSDGSWVSELRGRGVAVADFRPANCGFDVAWSEAFGQRFAGQPVKSVAASSGAGTFQGEFVITRSGIEGSLVYAHSSDLRDRLDAGENARLVLNLAPGRPVEKLARDLARQDAKASFSNRLRKGAGIDGVKAALLRELMSVDDQKDPQRLAGAIKSLDLPVLRPRPIEEAISSAGGICWDAVDDHYMLKALPGVFVAGEMLDWEAPTGGYLLSACLAMGRAAADGIEQWLNR
ncbi:TIGR03862 family flavoprotein [Rhizobiaceae bacterium n13]|uniref:TIGR03862 family flavoprotein n=1 Tax=Ferirhizobium litorale TaxID=2927786 RepID=A0AAE3QDW6_9HYPH|nr:TIGR03862 family flavoprotein [Fererhizobium litorale]MDI7863131.1 TIGR03862 family flavoprotein [Fererhizobium litorale]MDI7923191.1 TIGR03862 family flavoprotein [Fererhizobium litorale]